MKKIYIKPEMILVNIKLQRMIALSRGEGNADPNEETLSREEDWGRRRHHDDWDDEEEEEDW